MVREVELDVYELARAKILKALASQKEKKMDHNAKQNQYNIGNVV